MDVANREQERKIEGEEEVETEEEEELGRVGDGWLVEFFI